MYHNNGKEGADLPFLVCLKNMSHTAMLYFRNGKVEKNIDYIWPLC